MLTLVSLLAFIAGLLLFMIWRLAPVIARIEEIEKGKENDRI